MAYETLKNSIKQAIKQNGNQEITGDVMQDTLLNILGPAGLESGFLLDSMPAPSDGPYVEDDRHIYIPKVGGIYPNFGNLSTSFEQPCVFYKSDNQWRKVDIKIGNNHRYYLTNRFSQIVVNTVDKTITASGDGPFLLEEHGAAHNYQFIINLNAAFNKGVSFANIDLIPGRFVTVLYNFDTDTISVYDVFDTKTYTPEVINSNSIVLLRFHYVADEYLYKDQAIDGKYCIDYSISSTVEFDGHIMQQFSEKASIPAGLESGFKNMHIIGDSWTEGVGGGGVHYWDNLKKDCNLSRLTVDGIGGTTWTTNEANSFISRLSKIKADDDIVLILGGTNDYGHNQPLGTFSDTGTNTFYGALKAGIEAILTNNPTTTLCLVTPGQRVTETANSDGHTLLDYVNALLEVAEYYSVPVLNIYEGYITGKIVAVKNSLMPDGLHPNALGYKYLGRKIAKFINCKL